MTAPDPREVAAKLSKAQRTAIRAARVTTDGRAVIPALLPTAYRVSRATLDALVARGLAKGYPAILTPLGTAVAAHLSEPRQ